MATQTSLGDFKVVANAIRTAHLNGALLLYSGSQPASVQDAATGTLIGRATLNGGAWTAGTATNGISFDTAFLITGDNLALVKPAAANWQFTCLAAGTIGWARYVGNPVDAGLLDSAQTLARIDCSVSLPSGTGQLTASRITFSAADVNVAIGQISTFTYTLANALQPATPL